jgi:hypothetical protein
VQHRKCALRQPGPFRPAVAEKEACGADRWLIWRLPRVGAPRTRGRAPSGLRQVALGSAQPFVRLEVYIERV